MSGLRKQIRKKRDWFGKSGIRNGTEHHISEWTALCSRGSKQQQSTAQHNDPLATFGLRISETKNRAIREIRAKN